MTVEDFAPLNPQQEWAFYFDTVSLLRRQKAEGRRQL